MGKRQRERERFWDGLCRKAQPMVNKNIVGKVRVTIKREEEDYEGKEERQKEDWPHDISKYKELSRQAHGYGECPLEE